jgi:hypothetical protein
MRHYLLPLICVAALTGCGRNRDQQHGVTINGNGGSVTVSGSGEHMTIHDASGKQTVEINSNGGSAPSNMPDYVAVYPGAKITASVAGAGNNGNGGMMVEQTSASVADVIAFYKQKSAGAGFVEAMNMNTGGTTMFTAQSSDKKKSLSVVASTSNGATQAQVTWGTN